MRKRINENNFVKEYTIESTTILLSGKASPSPQKQPGTQAACACEYLPKHKKKV